MSSSVTSRLAAAVVDLVRVRPSAPSGVRSHTAYSTTRASARTAASTAGYDGTEPRPAVEPATSGTRSSSGTPSAPRKVETSGLSDCSPTAASTLATSSPETLSGGM